MMMLRAADLFTRMTAETSVIAAASVAQVNALIEHLRDASIETRWRAAAALGHAGDRRAISALCHLLEDDDRDVRMNAMIALVRLRADHTSGLIAERAFDPDEDHQTRYVAALALVALLGRAQVAALFAHRAPDDDGVGRAFYSALIV